MPKRSPTRQSIHDQRVKKEAQKLVRQGWNVKADLPGYDKPRAIGSGSRIPDIQATKRARRKLIEVETPDTTEKDRKQQETFRRHASQKPNTSFDVVVTRES